MVDETTGKPITTQTNLFYKLGPHNIITSQLDYHSIFVLQLCIYHIPHTQIPPKILNNFNLDVHIIITHDIFTL